MQTLLMIVVMCAVFYMLMVRPQQRRLKEHQAMLAKLGTGDVVVTRGGVIGRIASVTDDLLVLALKDGSEVYVPRSYVEGKYTGALPAPATPEPEAVPA